MEKNCGTMRTNKNALIIGINEKYIQMSYTEISNEHLETLEDTHILLFHEEREKLKK